MRKNEIKKIVLDIDGKEISLNVAQAKKFYRLLDELFGDKNTYIYPTYPSTPWRWPYRDDVYYSTSGDNVTYNNTTAELRM
jgi:hypothetical protein